MKTWIQTAIIAVIFLAAHSGTFADDPKPGDKVAAKWGTFSYYIATITSLEANGKFSVKYGDGDTGVVAPGDVEPVDAARELPIGTHVLACWHGAVMYPGTITARRDNRYTVKWDDGSAPSEVARDRMAMPRREAAAAVPAGGLAIGTSVAAKWGAGSYFIATITGGAEGGKFRVEYGDGDKGDVAAPDMVPVDAKREILIGAPVLACWVGAGMFPGTVTARTGNNYTVKWDDGDAPREVPREKIAPLPNR